MCLILHTHTHTHTHIDQTAGLCLFLHCSGEEETAVLLLERGADPRRPSAIRHRTPLHMAALANHVQVLQVLLQMDVDVNAKVSVASAAVDYKRPCPVRKPSVCPHVTCG